MPPLNKTQLYSTLYSTIISISYTNLTGGQHSDKTTGLLMLQLPTIIYKTRRKRNLAIHLL